MKIPGEVLVAYEEYLTALQHNRYHNSNLQMSTVRNKERLKEKVNSSKAVLDNKIIQLCSQQWVSTETIKLAFLEKDYVLPQTMLNSLELYVKVKTPKVAARTIQYHLGEYQPLKSTFKYKLKAGIINLLNKW